MLAITVELLHGTMRAASSEELGLMGETDEGDWPPSPARLFAALVAADGTRARCRLTSGEELLLLENAASPRILASVRSDVLATQLTPRYVVVDGTTGSTVQNYPARIATEVRPGVRLAPRETRVVYLWDDIVVTPDYLAALEARAARVGYLGCSDSPVRLKVSAATPPSEGMPAWVPDEQGDATVPVPFPGLLKVLDRMYDDFTAGMPARRSWYRTEVIGYRPPDQARRRIADQQWPYTFWLELTAPLPGRRALDVAQALKAATLATYAELHEVSREEMPAVLTGHMPPGARNYNVAQWVALPNVGYAHSDGRLHGALVMLPCDTEPAVVQRLGSAVDRLRELHLQGGRGVGVGTLRRGVAAATAAGRPSRWSQSSKIWASALPAIAERRVRGGIDLDEVRRWCLHAGFPEPEFATVSSEPLIPGALRLAPSEVFRSDGHGERRPYRHLLLVFDAEVAGPMVLGRGRQFGLGLMAPALAGGR